MENNVDLQDRHESSLDECSRPQLHNVKGNNVNKINLGEKYIKEKNRVWELDFLRGIALILMIYFHVIFDMKDIFGYNVDYSKGFNKFTGSAAGVLFIAISGISCTLSRNNAKRALRILGIAVGITVITHLYNADMGIKFGILHFLGFSILLYYLLEKLNVYFLAVIGTAILAGGRYISTIKAGCDYFFILGITSGKFVSADYYPLIPWLGVFIYGIIVGKTLYKGKKSIFDVKYGSMKCKDNTTSNAISSADSATGNTGSITGGAIGSAIRIISWMGKNTLIIYIVHQPVILLIITLIEKLCK